MSRIGKQLVVVPQGVTLTIEGSTVEITGPKGAQTVNVPLGVTVNQDASEIMVTRVGDDKRVRAAHGLVRAMIANGIVGVTQGFKKQLEVNGVGFKIQPEGKNLKLALGLSHDIIFPLPSDVTVSVDKNVITLEGISKQRVGQIAAEIRALKKPEPYKGKGIKYIDEHIVRKAGKTAGSGD